jgi:hypothetical protein
MLLAVLVVEPVEVEDEDLVPLLLEPQAARPVTSAAAATAAVNLRVMEFFPFGLLI